MSIATVSVANLFAVPTLRLDRPVLRPVKEQFFGTWKLVSWKVEDANGTLTNSPLGPNPLGWIMYDPAGRVSVAFMRPDRPNFASNLLTEATPEEIKIGFEGYMGYCGYYEVNEQERFVIHRLQLSWFPNWVGTQQKRYFEFEGDRLTTLVDVAQAHSLIWQRLN